MTTDYPNVLVVVMDCVRALDFPGGRDAVSDMPFTESLARSSVHYPRAATVAPWTIPAHASIFTGLYPWNHGAHARRGLELDAKVPRLPELLQRHGYRTQSLSANPFISPTFNLDQGFDQIAWGGWSESFLRLPRDVPPEELRGPQQAVNPRPGLAQGPIGAILRRFMHDAYRFPFAFDAANRLAQRIVRPNSELEQSVAPWIEPTFARWIGSVPSGQPFFCFVNFVDAHEPYYPSPAQTPNLRSWGKFVRVRQDHLSYVAGRWSPSPSDLALLHQLYRQSIGVLDRRLSRLAQTLKSAGRWDNTLVVLTSDHGQAFGEHGMLFHMFRVVEPELRIPLFVRYPHGRDAGRSARGWASLVDIAPTICELAGISSGVAYDGVPLQSLIDHERPGPALAMADGLIWDRIRARFAGPQLEKFDRVYAAAYDVEYKAVVDQSTGSSVLFNVESDPGELSDLSASAGARGALVTQAARDAGGRIGATIPETMSNDVEERLRSWGYI